jgi:hypothetical protein
VIVVARERRQVRAINAAAAIAWGESLATMDEDTQLGDARVLERLVTPMEQDSTIGMPSTFREVRRYTGLAA